jgi:hypothetical protein
VLLVIRSFNVVAARARKQELKCKLEGKLLSPPPLFFFLFFFLCYEEDDNNTIIVLLLSSYLTLQV